MRNLSAALSLLSAGVLSCALASCSSDATNASANDQGSEAGATSPDAGALGPDATSGHVDAASAVDGAATDSADASASVDTGHPDGPMPADPCVEAGTCPIGVWTDVTPAGMNPAVLRPSQNAYGPGSVVANPARPQDLYVGGAEAGLWKSNDYGMTWTLLDGTLPAVPRGVCIAVAGTTPATIWSVGYNTLYKSTDDGAHFDMTGGNLTQTLYSLRVDPYDNDHLISGLHEVDGIMESIDGGGSWQLVGGANWPSGGISWFPFFIDTGAADTTRHTWFAIAQNGGSAVMTSDGGANWTIPNGISGLQHPHGNAQIFQNGSTLVAGGVAGPGQGIYRSADMGANWARVDSGQYPEAIVWGSQKSVYAMYAWACSSCDLGTDYQTAPLPGTTWSKGAVPDALTIGPNSVAVVNDGAHDIFVGVMWDQGIWRYIEP